MEQWEYMPTYIEANADKKDIRNFLREKTGVKRPPRYMVEAVMPELNKFGEQGWELVHMEPVQKVRKKGDVLFASGYRWSNVYFCVFKRRKPGSAAPVLPLRENGTPAFRSETEPDPLLPVAPKPPNNYGS